MLRYLLTVTRQPRCAERPTAHVALYDSDETFKRGPLSASIGGDGGAIMMRYGCEGMAGVRQCLADEGWRCNCVSWVVGLLDGVTYADGTRDSR